MKQFLNKQNPVVFLNLNSNLCLNTAKSHFPIFVVEKASLYCGRIKQRLRKTHLHPKSQDMT